jgi:hypothetical protein
MESHKRTAASQQVLTGPLFQSVLQAATIERLRTQFLNRLKGIVQNAGEIVHTASEILTPTDSLPALGQPAKNPVIEAAENVINRRWNQDELRRVGENDPQVAQRYHDEVRRLIQKSRSDVDRSMSAEELIDLRQEEQHYEERLKIRMKQRTLNIPWPQRGDVMHNYEARLVARIERCYRSSD